ncbi:conserved hypothetical protein [Neospora caninum Liverpool]|uniref:Uncharacterized protein n=1 Tax=Neospora caninum (strain Liverpool) TaxID=572307 RepID=F0VJ97_NEOCL|nr:conserved hypothetical protein [Neospora caninum Liverpool]CBZ53808.1 conserved hypothetical protein [Neospora caninum Liverpool]|eukprot:XP_003883840.1 conserved hypothetical protein [Neospora caninum Liverpool]
MPMDSLSASELCPSPVSGLPHADACYSGSLRKTGESRPVDCGIRGSVPAMLPSTEAAFGESQGSNPDCCVVREAPSTVHDSGDDGPRSTKVSGDDVGQSDEQLPRQGPEAVAAAQSAQLCRDAAGSPARPSSCHSQKTSSQSPGHVASKSATDRCCSSGTPVGSDCSLPSPQENPVGYRNLALFVSTVLDQCGEAVARQRRASAMCLFFALKRAMSAHNASLLNWAYLHWRVHFAMTPLPQQKNRVETPSNASFGVPQCSDALQTSMDIAEDGGLLRMIGEGSLSRFLLQLRLDGVSSPSDSGHPSGRRPAGHPSPPSRFSAGRSLPRSSFLDSRDVAGPSCGAVIKTWRGERDASEAGASLGSPSASLPLSEAPLPATKSLHDRTFLLNKASPRLDSAASRAGRSTTTFSKNADANPARGAGSVTLRSAPLGPPTTSPVDEVSLGLSSKLFGQKARRPREDGTAAQDPSSGASPPAHSEAGKPGREGATRRECGGAGAPDGRGGVASDGVTSRNSISSRCHSRGTDENGARRDGRRDEKEPNLEVSRRGGSSRVEEAEPERLPAAAASLLSKDYESLLASALCRAVAPPGAAGVIPAIPWTSN